MIEDRQTVAAGYAPTSGPYFVEHVEALDMWRSRRIKITKQPTAISSASALQADVFAPFQFPGLMVNYLQANYRRAEARLVKHTVLTWWVNNTSKPVIPSAKSLPTARSW